MFLYTLSQKHGVLVDIPPMWSFPIIVRSHGVEYALICCVRNVAPTDLTAREFLSSKIIPLPKDVDNDLGATIRKLQSQETQPQDGFRPLPSHWSNLGTRQMRGPIRQARRPHNLLSCQGRGLSGT